MKAKTTRNVRLYAENAEYKHGFNIYLDFSGQREFLMFQRHNGLAYSLLKDGVRVDDLRRIDPYRILASEHISRRSYRRKSDHLTHTLDQIAWAVSDYLEERDCFSFSQSSDSRRKFKFNNSYYEAA